MGNGYCPHLIQREPASNHDGRFLVTASADQHELVAPRAGRRDASPRDHGKLDGVAPQPLRYHPRSGLDLDLDVEALVKEETFLLGDVRRHLADTPQQ